MPRPLEVTRFDPADYLKSDEAVAEYLTAAMETGDAAFIADAIGVVARARGMTRIARETGLSRESLYRALSAEGNPEFETVLRVIQAFGLRLEARAQHGNAPSPAYD